MKKLMCLFCAALLLAVSQTWAEAKPPVKDYATGAWSEEYGAMSTGSLFIPAKDDETIDWDTLRRANLNTFETGRGGSAKVWVVMSCFSFWKILPVCRNGKVFPAVLWRRSLSSA